jgi:hypothetical protein
MFFNARTSILALMVAATGVAVNAETASAAGRYGVTTIENPLNVTVKFAFRSGKLPWQIRTLKAGESRQFWYEYPTNVAVSPQLQIRMDTDVTSGKYIRTFDLKRYSVSSLKSRGKRYQFKFDGSSGRFIAPFAAN